MSQQLWGTQGKGPAIPFDTAYETGLLNTLLPNLSSVSYQNAQFNATKISSGQLAILAALAHERGHILWYLVNNVTTNPGASYKPDIPCSDNSDPGFFRDWRTVDPPPRWRSFGDLQDEHRTYAETGIPSDNVQAADLFVAAVRKNPIVQNYLLAIYSSIGRWASAFATFSPDEDFVETFKLLVLADPSGVNLVSLPLYVNGQAAGDIPGDLARGNKMNPDLMAKINSCIAPYVGAQPLPLLRLR